jgi:hypothetical protein
MLKNRRRRQVILPLLLFTCMSSAVNAQFTLSGQLRTRTELRNGLGNLVLKGSKGAAFTSQRTRLLFNYKWDRLNFGVSLQDVRVWGQDASTVSNNDGNKLMVHEAWAELMLANSKDSSIKFKFIDQLSLKIGRQELNYDDARLIGNLDWLQQARRHDMALLKASHKGWQIELGYAFNQNSDAFGISSTAYLPANLPAYVKNSKGTLVPTPAGMLPLSLAGNANNSSIKSGNPVWTNPPGTNGITQDYKSFTSLYVSRKIKQTKLSALFFNDNFGKYRLDSSGDAGTGYVYGRRFISSGSNDKFDYSGALARFTYGLMINQEIGSTSPGASHVAIQAAYYRQAGRNRDGLRMSNAHHYTLSATYQKSAFSITPGYDVLSGNNAATAADEKFDPLYGTPHRHWGYMDYFYVGTGSAAGGLNNPYLKVKYTAKSLTAGIDLHNFALNQDMYKADGKEADLLVSYRMNRFTSIEMGYSIMKATRNMPLAKSQASDELSADAYRKTGTWFYAMFRFTPEFFSKN